MSQLPITITGHLTHDPELTKISEEVYKARIRVASSRRVHVLVDEESGKKEWRDSELIYIDAEMWGQFAVNIKKSLKRGMPVIVIGSVVTDNWEGKNGENNYRTYIKAFYVGLDLNRYVISSVKVEQVFNQEGLKAPWLGQNPPEIDIDRTEPKEEGEGHARAPHAGGDLDPNGASPSAAESTTSGGTRQDTSRDTAADRQAAQKQEEATV